MALNTIWSTSGIGPALTSNSSNSPGLIAALPVAVQVICETASVICCPFDSTGLGSFSRFTSYVQPACGLTLTLANGVSTGKATATLVVDALSLSVGTLNVSAAYDPWVASRGLTVT